MYDFRSRLAALSDVQWRWHRAAVNDRPVCRPQVISIIDDDASVRAASDNLLRSLGYAVKRSARTRRDAALKIQVQRVFAENAPSPGDGMSAAGESGRRSQPAHLARRSRWPVVSFRAGLASPRAGASDAFRGLPPARTRRCERVTDVTEFGGAMGITLA
jgi:hypothetical protein